MKNKIKEFRKKNRITQQEFADAIDITRQTVNALESGKGKVSIVLAYKIASFFQVRIEDVFVLNEDPKILQKNKQKRSCK